MRSQLPPEIDLVPLGRMRFGVAEQVLMRRYRPTAELFARHFSPCSGEQDQIVSETFLKLFSGVRIGWGPQTQAAFARSLRPMVRWVAHYRDVVTPPVT